MIELPDEKSLEIEKPSKPEIIKSEKVTKTEKFNNVERIPSNWTIKSSDKGITAYNNITRKMFEGSVKEFNRLLRG